MILKMSDCDANKKLLQTMQMLRCKDQCTNKDVVTFTGKDDSNMLQNQVDKLNSPAVQQRLSETFADMFEDDDDEEEVSESFLQNKTKFNNPPTPRTKVPGNPCTDKYAGAPSPEAKRAAKCTLKKSPQCYKLQGRFLQIQAEIADVRDDLMEQIAKKESDCDETRKSLEASIAADKSLLASSQTKLAEATEKESTAGEKGRQVAKENDQYNADLEKQMKTC